MALLRVASLVVVAIWTGGLAVLGFVAAPEIFATLEAAGPANGRALAGQVFGAVFARFQHVAWILGAVLIGLLIARAPARTAAAQARAPRLLGRRRHDFARASATRVLRSRRGSTPIRRETTGSVAALAGLATRARREFGRLHALSNVFMLITLAGGVGLLLGGIA